MRIARQLPLFVLVAFLGQSRFGHAAGPAEASVAVDRAPAVELSAGSSTWWEGFEDQRLDALVEAGLGQNLDVRAAELRVAESETLIAEQRSPLLPTVTWDSRIDIAPTDSLGFQFGGAPGGGGGPTAEPPPDIYWTGSSVLNARLDLDITGKQVLTLRASRDDLSASKQDLASSKVSIAGSVATAYYDLVAARARARVVEEQVATVTELLELTEGRYKEGRAVATDLLQQRQQLASTQSLRPQAQAQVRAFSQQLATLLGEPANTEHDTADRLPEIVDSEVPADPIAMVNERPDVRAGQERVAAAEKRLKVARRDFAPTLSVQGNAGVQAIRITEVNDQWFWGAGASLSVPIYTGGRRASVLKQRKAQEASSRNEVERLRLEAQRQVEDARAASAERRQILEASRAELQFATESYEALRARYFEGDVDVINLLTALTSKQQAELNLVTAHRDLVVAHIDLQRALAPAPRT